MPLDASRDLVTMESLWIVLNMVTSHLSIHLRASILLSTSQLLISPFFSTAAMTSVGSTCSHKQYGMHQSQLDEVKALV